MDDGNVVCLCCGVTAAEIAAAVEKGARSLDEVRKLTGAGRSCGMCLEKVGKVTDSELKKHYIDGD